MSPSSYSTPDTPSDDPLAALTASLTVPSPEDEQLARAWSRAAELARALRETAESLAVERNRNRVLEEEIAQLRRALGAGAGV